MVNISLVCYNFLKIEIDFNYELQLVLLESGNDVVLVLQNHSHSPACLIPETGLVYPEAQPYVHDPAGDASDNSYPEAEAYVHDTTGDAQRKSEIKGWK